MIVTNKINGYYIVNGQHITNKLHAILEASKTKSELEWVFYDDVFAKATETFNKHDVSLKELYRARAQQLRDSYDYLILNYSGGSDSHNILMTFLEYGIKLDHVYIQWPERLMDKGIYTPNNIDRTNGNFHSEWDLVLKKDLEWLGMNHPEITIEISDWTNTLKEKFYRDDIFANDVSNLPSIARAQKQNTFSETEGRLALQGKKVASIFGVDKPMIVKKEDKWFYYFADAMKRYFQINVSKEYLIEAHSIRKQRDPMHPHRRYNEFYFEYAQVSEISKLVCYPYWDFNRFQADKPFAVLEGFKLGMRAWDNILTHVPDFDRVQQAWAYHWKSYLAQIDSKFMRNQDTVLVCKTKWHYLP